MVLLDIVQRADDTIENLCALSTFHPIEELFTSWPILMLVEDTSADEPGTSTVWCSEVKSLSLAWAPDCTVLDVFNSHFGSGL